MATIEDQVAEILELNAGFFRNFNQWSAGMVQVLAGTPNDPNSFAADGTKSGDLGYYPVVNVSGQTIYVPCLLRLREIARSLTPASRLTEMRALAIPGATGAMVQLHEAGRAGMFRYDTSDQSANVSADVDGAIYVAPNARSNGSLGAWIRVRDNRALAVWTGMTTATENADVLLNRFMLLLSAGDWTVLPNFEAGIGGKVTMPKFINMEGGGKFISGLMARGAAKNFHGIHCRFGYNHLRNFYCGGMKGQLTVGEAAAFHAYPGEVNQPATVTGDISDMTWENLRAVDCETGYRWGYNVTDTTGGGRLYHAKASWMVNCDSEGVLSHNVELFAPDDISVIGGNHYMVLQDSTGKTAADPPKMVRIIGPRRAKITKMRLYGHGATSLVGGIHLELASPYSKANYWSLPGDIEVTDMFVSGCPTAVHIPSGTQGNVTVKNIEIRGIAGQLSIGLRLGATGYLIQPQVVRDSPPPDAAAGELGYKVSQHRVRFEDIVMFDCDEILRVEGKVDLATFDNIENYAAQVVAGRYACTFDKGGNDLDIYRVRLRNIRDYAARNVPTFIRVNDGRKGSEIYVDDCVASMTPNTAQRWPVTASATAQSNVAIRFKNAQSVRRISPALAATIAANMVERSPA